jgi:hypothetical protein
MRQFFELLSIFDWLTPTIGFLEDIINDPTLFQSNSWTFFIPYDQSLESGWNANGIENLMKQHGVKTWGGQITGGEFFFSVKLEQAQWAEYLLNQNSVPLSPLSQGAPRPEGKSVEKTDSFFEQHFDQDKPPFFLY